MSGDAVRARRKSSFLTAVLLLALLPVTALAQEGVTSGSVAGTVFDAAGEPLPNAEVTVRSVERGTERTVLTNDRGRFLVGLLPPGLYELQAEFPPLEPVRVRNIQVSSGERASVQVTLAPVEATDIEVAVGERVVDLAGTGVVDLVDETQIDNLPTAGRDFTDFINLSSLVGPQPAATTGGQFSIGGARSATTNVQVDGTDANNAFFGENRGSSRLPFSVSLNSLKEFQVISNGYDVEYGRFSGGVVNAVTKSGGNEFDAGAHFFWRDEALTKEDFDGSPATAFEAFQFGGYFSGPIVKDELHFFLSADLQRWDQPAFALTSQRSGVPASTLQELQDILVDVYGFDPSDLQDDFGVFTETQDEEALFGRVDWTVSQDHRLSVRANYTNFDNVNDGIPSTGLEARTLGSTFIDESFSLVSEWNSTYGTNVSNTFRMQYSIENRPRPGNSLLPTAVINGVGTADGGATTILYGGDFFGITFTNNLEEDKLQLTDNLSVNLGDHTLKLGTDNVFTNTFNMFWLNGNGFFTFDDLNAFRNGNSNFFLRFVPQTPDGGAPEPPTAEFDTREYSVYVQDEWRASDRLKVTAGLRWDFVDLDEPDQLADPAFRSIVEGEPFNQDVTTVPEDSDNIGPRLSFRYDMEGDESEIVRGGAGLFYARIPTVLHSNVMVRTPRPLLALGCFGPGVPEFDFGAWQGNPDAIPTACEGGVGFTGAPVIDVWDPDTDYPTTFKANVGYDRQLGDRWRVGAEAIFSRSWNNFHIIDLNLQEAQFTSAEGRPVFVEPDDFDPTTSAGNVARAVDPNLDRLFQNTDIGEAMAGNLKLDIQGQPLDDLQVTGTYALNLAYDNSSFSCCIEAEAWGGSILGQAGVGGATTAGNPNFLGGVGDSDFGSWGRSSTERRHVAVINGMWRLPEGFQVNAIYRLQSGRPLTPVVNGDVNGDGQADNDRAFIPDPDDLQGVRFATPQDQEAYREILAREDCLREHVGTVVHRNACRHPSFHRLDLRLQKSFRTVGAQRAEFVVDLFNVLDGLGLDAGEFVLKERELLNAEGFDPNTNQVVYSVGNFGREFPVGFEPFQFQAQLGVRYRF